MPSAEIPRPIHERFAVRPLDLPIMTVQPALIHLKDRYLTSAAHAVKFQRAQFKEVDWVRFFVH